MQFDCREARIPPLDKWDLVAGARVLLHVLSHFAKQPFNPIADQGKNSGKICKRRGGSAWPCRETRNEDRGCDAADGVDAPSVLAWMRSDRVPGARANDVLSALVHGGSSGNRFFFRTSDAWAGNATLVRPGPGTWHRLLPGLRRTVDRERPNPSAQHIPSRGQERQSCFQVPQSAFAGPR
jgi:hypothetical protein